MRKLSWARLYSRQFLTNNSLLSALLGSFTSALNSSLQKSTSVSPSYSGSSSVSNYTGNSSSSEDNSGRKDFLRGQIADWKNKLNKAEASYRQAISSGDDTWEKKRVIESKRQTVDECLQMIKQYESEQNSQK